MKDKIGNKKRGGGWNKGKHHVKATREQAEERVEAIAKYLREHPLASRFDLHKKFCSKLGLAWQSVDVYAERARRQLQKESKMTSEQGRAFGVGVLLNLLSHPNPAIRIKAERSLAAIMGYDSPTQTRVGNPDGTSISAPIQAVFVLPEKKKIVDADEIEETTAGT